jgi:hypothetical protein
MKTYLLAAAFLACPAFSASVLGQSGQAQGERAPQTVEDACVFVAKSVLMVRELKVGVDPPRFEGRAAKSAPLS